jgi:hypothetical protein
VTSLVGPDWDDRLPAVYPSTSFSLGDDVVDTGVNQRRRHQAYKRGGASGGHGRGEAWLTISHFASGGDDDEGIHAHRF